MIQLSLCPVVINAKVTAPINLENCKKLGSIENDY